MVASVTEAVGDGKELQARSSSRGTRKPRIGQGNGIERQRFFLAKAGGNHSVPEFGKEFPSEAEAMVESLKAGVSYFVISEWRGVVDFSGRKPQLSREAANIAPKAV
jgi:hypothetical protein